MRLNKALNRLFILIFGILILSVSMYAENHPDTSQKLMGASTAGSYRVVEFSDGDTISVDMNGKTERIRFIGVDTPETHDPRKAVECFGRAASEYTKQLIGAEGWVRLEADELSTNRDRYDRLLRYVYTADNLLVQAEIIKNGYGFAYVSFPFSKLEEFREYEKQAREANKGLWSGCQPYLDTKGYIHTNPTP